jgi:hypothetical protein
MFPIAPRQLALFVLALALDALSLPASARASADANVAAVEAAPTHEAPMRSSGATKGTIAGGFCGAIAGTMLAASLERRSTPQLMEFEGPRGSSREPSPVLRVGVGLATTAFGAILGRAIGASGDHRAAARRHGDAGPAIDHALRDLRSERGRQLAELEQVPVILYGEKAPHESVPPLPRGRITCGAASSMAFTP